MELLDENIFEFVTNLYKDFVSKLRRYSTISSTKGQGYSLIDFFAEGNSIDEFCNGILNFLSLIGYDKQEIEIPFHDLVRAFRSDRSSHDESSIKPLKILSKDNDATITLSNSVLALAIDNEQVYEFPFNVSFPVKYVTGIIYTVVDSLNSNADEIFETVAEHIEAIDIEPSVNSCHATLRYLAALQLFASTVDLGDIEGTHNMIYSISRKISGDCLEAYSEDTEVKFMKFTIDEIHSIHRKVAECYGESNPDSSVFCRRQYLLSVILLPLTFPFPGFSSLKAIHDVLLHPLLYQNRWLTYIYDRTGEESIGEDVKLLKRALELFPKRSCQEYVCHCMLCNSHGAFSNYQNNQDMRDQEEMAPKTEL